MVEIVDAKRFDFGINLFAKEITTCPSFREVYVSGTFINYVLSVNYYFHFMFYYTVSGF
jgi:hypothetical protein